MNQSADAPDKNIPKKSMQSLGFYVLVFGTLVFLWVLVAFIG